MTKKTYINITKAIVKRRLNKIPDPSFCTFIVTWRCNARCTICDIWKMPDCKEMNVEQISSVFSQLKNLDVIRITGGEPFLRTDLVDIVNMIQRKIIPQKIHITTNGLLTEKILRFVKSVDNPNNIHIKVSIDAVEDKHDRIRGINGIYEKAIKTVQELVQLRSEYRFYLGINQTISDNNAFDDMKALSNICKKLNIGLHQVLAYDSVPLYSKEKSFLDTVQFKPVGNFSKEDLKKTLEYMNNTSDEIDDLIEQKLKKYYLKGLYNRLILNSHIPNPKCEALRSHIRILPNGDIPVCLFKNNIVGNVIEKNVADIWFGDHIKKYRKEIDKCPGCWAGCEIIPNAVYSGGIVRSIFY